MTETLEHPTDVLADAPPRVVTVEPELVALKRDPFEPIPDGIYLDLPMKEYVRDLAVSGSRIHMLLTEPGGVQWEGPANPLWEDPDDDPKKDKPHLLRGRACHTAILEGLDVYGAQYIVPPANLKCLRTGGDMGDWLADHGLKKSGTVAEQRERILAVRDTLPEEQRPIFFDEFVGDRTLLREQDDQYVRLLAHFVRSDQAVAPFLEDGFAEVSVFLTVKVNGEPVRLKCRMDWVNFKYLLDLKSYGRPPRRDRSLRRHLVNEAWWNGYDLQAVHNDRVWRMACERYVAGKLRIRLSRAPLDEHVDAGEHATRELARFNELVKAHMALYAEDKRPEWFWLFVRMAGAPTSMLIPFDAEDDVWRQTADDIDAALVHYAHLRKTCGADQLWLTSAGVHPIEELDWPIQAKGGRL